MVLLTKEVFVQLKLLSALYVQVTTNHYPPHAPVDAWQVVISGHVDVGSTSSYDCFSVCIQAKSEEDAERIFKELVQQVVDSGRIPELSAQLIDSVLKEK